MNAKRLRFIDKAFIFALLSLLIFGLVILRSASIGISSDPFFYLKKQVFIIFLGLAMAILIIRYDYSQFRRFSPILYGISIILLVAVLIWGTEIRGTTGWIGLGSLPMVQPAEFTKVLLILAFAEFLNHRKGELDTLSDMLPCFLFMGIPFLLIILQPDLGTALVYIAITLVMMFAAGANSKILIQVIAVAVGLVALGLYLHVQFGMCLPLEDYQLKRLTIFLNPYEDGQGGRGMGWNTIQSLVAIGSGGLTGKGLFQGTQVQLNFLPEHHTDFIYAVIGEELGFLGAAFVIICYGVLLIRAIIIALNSKELFGSLLVLGITAMWLFHVFESIGMSIGLMPITGIPLPFLSYGGSSMLSNLIAAGLILSVNVRGKKIVF
ncbi:MAG: rod shape-determining protein RodA [Syntrophomonas sp.]|uniref:rod shape-determining protein RodA n=1 Tax=Syntrophomonas sp. TaxID=2053627 RepID=UPI00261DAC1A|nr:rod shape-determining protein RodA [Syntrophomonas sp.]MDD2510180.1 rod shape-determining protein RodA [Syntrophomonas sp.]MDD3879168.1 rod shape-determining protein RodA [Syntrophomonas sp.]MDD4625787.1 rod shape-determining protein RodA [Syntrophomonas sp.]